MLGLFLFIYYVYFFFLRFQKIRKVLTRVLARVLALMLVSLDYTLFVVCDCYHDDSHARCCFDCYRVDERAFVVLIVTMMCNSIALRLV